MGKGIQAMREQPEQTALQDECEQYTRQIAAAGLQMNIDPRTIHIGALVQILIDRGLLTQEEFALACLRVHRNILRDGAAQATEVRANMDAEAQKTQRVSQLVVPGRNTAPRPTPLRRK